jgi:hypothetical protein
VNQGHKYTAVAIDHNQVALINVEQKPRGSLYSMNALKIMESSSMDDGGYQPAESVIVKGDAILRLRDALNEAFPPEEKFNIVQALKEVGGCAEFNHGFAGEGHLAAIGPEAAEDARVKMNHIGKAFYDAGFAVETIDGFTIRVETKEDK